MFLPKHAALFLSIAMRNIQGYNLRSLHSNNQEKKLCELCKYPNIASFSFFVLFFFLTFYKQKKNTEVDVSL